KTLAREIRTLIQTDKYVGRKNDGTASHSTLRILRERQEENRERRQRLVLDGDTVTNDKVFDAVTSPSK
ncbi:MAG: hypothetical protein WBM40_21845, partial [Thiohalocapsa sp.]